MDEEFKKLITDVIAEHPGPWKQRNGYGDNGGRYTSIVDAKYNEVFDGQFGFLSESVFNLLLNFPEMTEGLLTLSKA